MPKLILDASIIICWGEELQDTVIHQELIDIGHSMVVPNMVRDEITPLTTVTSNILDESEIKSVDESVYDEVNRRYFQLGKGEKSVLALGWFYEEQGVDYRCVLDDKQARRACEKQELELTGTIGLLAELIQHDRMTLEQADQHIKEMKKQGTRLSKNHLELLQNLI